MSCCEDGDEHLYEKIQTLRIFSLSDRLSGFTAAWRKLGIWPRREE